MRNKYDFINDILESKKLTATQRERVLKLAVQEIRSEVKMDEDLLTRLKEIEEKISQLEGKSGDRETENKNQLTHNPKLVSKYLKKFKDNTPLKWATHVWDEKKYETIDLFIEDLNKDKDHNALFNSHRDLFNLINYFIYQPKVGLDENEIPKYGWPNLHDLKIGWQFPNNLLINWCRENFDNKEDNKKYPFQFNLPKELQPKKPIKGKMITTFENVVDTFKTEIQFREDYLYKELKKRISRLADYNFKGIEDFKNLDFYTYTHGFLSAIDTVLNEIRKNETEKNLLFSYEMQANELFIDITQLNSYPTRRLNTNNLVQFLGGGMNAISSSIFSLCDFSIISNFTDEKNNKISGELCIVYDSIKGNWSGKDVSMNTVPKLQEYNKEVTGFTYRFKFYL